MAAARSTLLDGLEDISEDEQLRRVLELSRGDAGPGPGPAEAADGASSGFQDWVRSSPEERMRRLHQVTAMGSASATSGDSEKSKNSVRNDGDKKPRDDVAIYNSDSDNDEDLRRVIEMSKECLQITEEEKTRLAIQQSQEESTISVGSTQQLVEAALRLSLLHQPRPAPAPAAGAGPLTPPSSPRPQSPAAEARSLTPLGASSPRPTRARPLSLDTQASSRPASVTLRRPASASPDSMTEEEQVELALQMSQNDPASMTEDEQLKLALRLSATEGGLPAPATSSLPRPGTASQPRRGHHSGPSLGARPRVQQQPAPPPAAVTPSVPVCSTNTASQHPAALAQAEGSLRTIVVDGMNVCKTLGKGDDFRTEGLFIVYNWFADRGHKVIIVLPQSIKSRMMGAGRREEVDKLERLERSDILVYSPSRRTDQRSWNTYDDIFIVQIAAKKSGIVVSNDNFKDILKNCKDHEDFDLIADQIRNRVLGFSLVGEDFYPPYDPLGKGGPNLTKFLKF